MILCHSKKVIQERALDPFEKAHSLPRVLLMALLTFMVKAPFCTTVLPAAVKQLTNENLLLLISAQPSVFLANGYKLLLVLGSLYLDSL